MENFVFPKGISLEKLCFSEKYVSSEIKIFINLIIEP